MFWIIDFHYFVIIVFSIRRAPSLYYMKMHPIKRPSFYNFYSMMNMLYLVFFRNTTQFTMMYMTILFLVKNIFFKVMNCKHTHRILFQNRLYNYMYVLYFDYTQLYNNNRDKHGFMNIFWKYINSNNVFVLTDWSV